MTIVHPTYIHLHRLNPTPYTIHADWRPTTFLQTITQKQIIEIVSEDQKKLSICAQLHSCITQPLLQDSVMLTTSTCKILTIKAGSQVRISPVTLHKILLKEDLQIFQNSSTPNAIISSALATLLGLSLKDHPQLVLCPSVYTATRQNIQVNVTDIKVEEKPIVLAAGNLQVQEEEKSNQILNPAPIENPSANIEAKNNPSNQNTHDTETNISDTSSPCIWLHPKIRSSLGLEASSYVYLYLLPSRDANPLAQVLQHPGFCYLTSSDINSMNIQEEAIVELRAKKSMVAYVQVHPLLENMQESSIETSLGDALQVERHALTLTAKNAKLYWTNKTLVDDIQNKARAGIRLSQEAMKAGGYTSQELVTLFHEGKPYEASIELPTQPLPEGTLSATSLLLRSAQLDPGQAVFLSLEHTPFATAAVGILNVDELEEFCAKGSSQLASTFKMPCWVQLQNTEKGTSLDILLKPDPYPRKNTLVRMSRTTRQMLLFDRGNQVVVRPIIPVRSLHPIRAFLPLLLKVPIYQLLRFLIKRRIILVSLAPAHTWDDQAQVARIDTEALTVLGISEGDRIRITYRGKSISRVTLSRDANYKDPVDTPGADNAVFNLVPDQFQLGLDAVGRYRLGGGKLEFGTVVEIERDMGFVFFKSLNLALLPVIGTVLTLITFFSKLPAIIQILIGLFIACLLFYIALSTERAKVV
jgi:hypothetical protein